MTDIDSRASSFLTVDDLKVHFPTADGVVKATDGLSFNLERGKTLGIVGESGSGKSVSSSAILGLHRGTSALVSGRILLDGTDLLTLSDEEMRLRRGKDVAMIFQDPLSAMHPYFTVGNQIGEAYRVHNDVSKKAARARAIEMLDRVGIPQPDRRVDDYPHQFSGGMRQRAMIAMGLINNPGLLIADEPTTALDVTVQAQILDLLQDLQREFDSAIIIITHDLGRGRRDGRRRAGHVRRPGGRVRHVQGDPHPPGDALHLGAALERARRQGRHRRPADPDPGQPAEPAQPADGLPVPPALRPPGQGAGRPVPDRPCPSCCPALAGGDTSSACHLANPDEIYRTEVLPEIAPELAEER